MKTVRTSIIASMILVIISLAACKKNSSNAPVTASSTSKLAFQLRAVNSSSDSVKSDSVKLDTIQGLVWTAGTANVGKFSFEAVRKGVSINIFSHNMTNVDLFALTPLQTYVTLDTGVYKEIEIKAFLEKSDTIPPLKLTGTFVNDSTKTVPIEFILSDNTVVKVEENNIDISGTTDYTALLNMQLDRLTKGVTAADLNKAKLTGGVIIISAQSNSWLYWKMRSNITGCGWGRFWGHHKDHD
jgi:hypothetical protein